MKASDRSGLSLKGELVRDSPLPLYHQIKNLLEEQINRSSSPPDTLLPREMDIARFYQVSRITARQAVLELVKEGLCYRVKGQGTFTARGKIQQDFARRILSFNDEMTNKGLIPSTTVLTLEEGLASEEAAAKLGLREGDRVVKLDRLRFGNGEPLVIVETRLPFRLCSSVLKEDMERESLYRILSRKKETRVHRIVRTIEAVTAGKYESALLQIPEGHPIQKFSFVSYGADGTPLEYSLSRYRGDRNSFTLEIKVEN